MVAGLALFARVAVRSEPLDDAYITYRYAARLAAGKGLTFNDHERVLGTTTPAWAGVLASAEILGVRPHVAAPALNTVLGMLVAVLLTLGARRLGASLTLAAAVGVLWATHPMAVKADIAGMETSAFTAAVLGALLMVGRAGGVLEVGAQPNSAMLVRKQAAVVRQLAIAGLLAGIAALLRPEGWGVVVVLLVDAWCWRRWWAPTVAGIVLAPWVAIATAYYGSPLPHSVVAKSAAYGEASPLRVALRLLSDGPVFALTHGPTSPAITLVLVGLAIAALTWGLLALPRAWYPSGYLQSRIRFMAVWATGYLAVYAAARPVLCWWYMLPLAAVMLPVMAAGFERLTARAAPALARRAAIALLIAAVAGGVAGTRYLEDDTLTLFDSGREPAYERLTDRIGPQVHAGEVLMTGEIGVLGYRLPQARILDTVGLVSPEVVPYLRRGTNRVWGSHDLVLDLVPDWVVLPATLGPSPDHDEVLHQLYERVGRAAYTGHGGPWVGAWHLRLPCAPETEKAGAPGVTSEAPLRGEEMAPRAAGLDRGYGGAAGT